MSLNIPPKKNKLAYNSLYYITFYYTFSVIIIVSDLKIRSLQILHTEHYRVSLCAARHLFEIFDL